MPELRLTLVATFIEQHTQPLIAAMCKVPPILCDPRRGAHTLPPQAMRHAIKHLPRVYAVGGAQPVPSGGVLQVARRGWGGHGAWVARGWEAYGVKQVLKGSGRCHTIVGKHPCGLGVLLDEGLF